MFDFSIENLQKIFQMLQYYIQAKTEQSYNLIEGKGIASGQMR